jgi:hypothetical protein
MVLVAVAIIGVTLASLHASRGESTRQAGVASVVEGVRAAVITQWTQTLGPTCANLNARAASATARVNQLAAVTANMREPQRASLLAEATGHAASCIALTNGLAKCHAMGTNTVVQAGAASAMDTVAVQRERMQKLAGSLAEYSTYMGKFETTLADLDARVAKATDASRKPAAAPGPAPVPAKPPAPAKTTVEQPVPVRAIPVVPAGVDRLAPVEAAYVASLTNLAFAAVAKDARSTLARDGASLSKEQMTRLQALADRAELLAALKDHVVARLVQAPMPQGWIQTTPPSNILAADDACVTLKGLIVPWAQVPPAQFAHLVAQTVPNATAVAAAKARLLLAASLYCVEHGQATVGLHYRGEALKIDSTLQSVADRLLPALRDIRRKAAAMAIARGREAFDRSDALASDLRGTLLGTTVSGSLPVAYYRNIPSASIESLLKSGKFPDKPDQRETLTKLQIDSGHGYDYGAMARGLLITPTTGEYHFYAVADDAAEVWLGTGPNPTTKRRLIHVAKVVPSGGWTDREDQQSGPVQLEAGRTYYIEVRYKQGSATDLLRVGWKRPGSGSISVIDGQFLAPLPESALAAFDETSPVGRASHDAIALLNAADALVVAAQATLATADGSYNAAVSAESESAGDKHLTGAATAVGQALESLGKADAILAKARPLVERTVALRENQQP